MRVDNTILSKWDTWRSEWTKCRKCPIGELAYQHVLGEGNLYAKVLFVGEGPGRSEDTLGEPFVGRAGKLLNAILAAAGASRQSIFISNLVACRPCDERTGPNRPPTTDEVLNCRPRLVELVGLLQPRGIVLVGRPAQFHAQVMLKQMDWKGRIHFMTHPAAFLRQGGPKAPGYEKTIIDLKRFLEEV